MIVMRRSIFFCLLSIPFGMVWAEPEVPEPSAFDLRLQREQMWEASGLRLVPYKPNYLLPFGFMDHPNHLGRDLLGGAGLQNVEAQFQISLRVPVARRIFWGHGNLNFAYTQQSFWQVYNRRISSPFRSNTYEPEMFLSFPLDAEGLGWKLQLFHLGIVHQSNGREILLSRNWNRAYIQGTLARKGHLFILRPWIRLPEHSRTDDNPDIGRYMGNFEAVWALKWREYVFSTEWRNNLRFHGDNKGAVKLGVSFPINNYVKGMVQYFNGYGESLLDYNHPINRISIGLLFSDWL